MRTDGWREITTPARSPRKQQRVNAIAENLLQSQALSKTTQRRSREWGNSAMMKRSFSPNFQLFGKIDRKLENACEMPTWR
jgi:hypothetical protein